MNTPKTSGLMDDALFRVERKIARRADELSRQLGYDPGHALDHWRQAEQEVWSEPEPSDGQKIGSANSAY